MTKVDVSCLCGKARTAARLKDSIPADSIICHRSQCRYSLGALCHSALAIKDRPANLELLQVYAVNNESISRYFCGTCGSHLFEHGNDWRVQSGAVEPHSEQVFDALEDIIGHEYVQDTGDGGMSLSLAGADNILPQNLVQENESCSKSVLSKPSPTVTGTGTKDDDHARLWARCVCGGVEFFVTRPDATSRSCSSPWPDLITPYRTQSSDNPTDEKWWIRDKDKWLAGTCACRSCRLGLGSPVQAWAFVSRSNLLQSDGSPLSYQMGSLRSFESSPGAVREFCNRCGATVFWHNQDRPGVVDVSVGLLRASEGVLARSWLRWWTDRVSFAEEALDKRLIARLESRLHYLDASMT